jgi:hypothetical protein
MFFQRLVRYMEQGTARLAPAQKKKGPARAGPSWVQQG